MAEITTIKIKGAIKFTGCGNCPFGEYIEERKYGEITGNWDAYCGLLNMDCSIMNDEPDEDGYPDVRKDRRSDCPIVEFNIQEEVLE